MQSQAMHSIGLLRVDWPLFLLTMAMMFMGLVILYSAAYEQQAILVRQVYRMMGAMSLFFILAQIHPRYYYIWTPWVFAVVMCLLLAVMVVGHVGKGAQRWLNLGVIKFQPSELLKLMVPMFMAWYFANKRLPPSTSVLLGGLLSLVVPTVMVAIQPDLGTAVMICLAGLTVVFIAGVDRRWLYLSAALGGLFAPLMWHGMHAYQKKRVLIFLNPERDPLGAGYHIIQSKIAIGSGGFWGKGWLKGTQSHLQFLPEHKTDFIFSVFGEEFGWVGAMVLIALVMCIVWRGMQIAFQTTDTFSKLLACSLTVTFFVSVFVNLGMVSGILPVVGLPLPLVSYGGSSSLVVMALLGVLMSIQTHSQRLH